MRAQSPLQVTHACTRPRLSGGQTTNHHKISTKAGWHECSEGSEVLTTPWNRPMSQQNTPYHVCCNSNLLVRTAQRPYSTIIMHLLFTYQKLCCTTVLVAVCTACHSGVPTPHALRIASLLEGTPAVQQPSICARPSPSVTIIHIAKAQDSRTELGRPAVLYCAAQGSTRCERSGRCLCRAS